MCACSPAFAQAQESVLPASQEATDLPEPEGSPLAIDFASDPILNLAQGAADVDEFRRIVAAALQENAVRREAEARINLAEAQVAEAKSGYEPRVDLSVNSFRTIARDFSNDPFNLLERSRPSKRTDALAEVEYTVFDFGAINAAIAAAEARLKAAGHDRDAAATQIVTQVVTTWYSVFAYQSLTRLAEGFVAAQDDIEKAVDNRIAQGASAPSEKARVASLRADGEIRLAQFQRRLASAEARFRELTGMEPPPLLRRAPLLEAGRFSRDFVVAAAADAPEVQSAEALAQAARIDVNNSRASQAPRVAARIDAGRYGVFEDREDYDVRASLNLRYRLFGGGGRARIDQAQARADAATATADRVKQESERDAAVVWADVDALEKQLVALEASYRSARQTRDVVFRRFAALRGSLFDVSEAQSAYLGAAVAYIEGLTELDAARYLLLARTGRLLDLFEREGGNAE
ncbi:TolC family protein [Qipengyuania soli]|uniref:TolC family protein n=1 Tax=Qipengyuania soli TaxID=2782568 RepID=A0A7S8F381_9SPHN|nr:TolC family protein [Qipengyuania soli]QPC98291.1 TolC family protein [Qipengyuania soli]